MKKFRIGEVFPEQLKYYKTHHKHHYITLHGEQNAGIGNNVSIVYYFLVGIFSLILLIRMFFLQIYLGSYYRSISNENRVKERIIPADRGVIVDRTGKILVRNIPYYYIDQGNNREAISRSEALTIESEKGKEAARLEYETKREYLYPFETSHILGYLGEVTKQEMEELDLLPGAETGKSGIEKQYDAKLRGEDGKELIEVDAMARPIRRLGKVDPKSGLTLKTTLDLELQVVAYRELLEAVNNERSTAGKKIKGAVIVSDSKTGEILSLVSTPSYNNNVFTLGQEGEKKLEDETIEEIFSDTDQPLFNRAISGVYPPGSTFKIITAASGLEMNKITKSTLIEDTGVIEIGPYKYPNWLFLKRGEKDGFINVISAIKRSNDIFFYKVGEYVGLSNLAIWAKNFGVGEKLGIDIPEEASGLFPSDSWKRENIKDKWYLGDTYHLAIGQGYLLVTPLQVNAFANEIARGGNLCRPYIVKIQDEKCKDIGLKKETVELIKEGMRLACEEGGTGWPLFNFQVISSSSKEPGKVSIACKTGTAEFGDLHDRTHAWFTAFAPVENPELTVTVLIEGAGEGSDVAAPVAKKIFEEWFKR